MEPVATVTNVAIIDKNDKTDVVIDLSPSTKVTTKRTHTPCFCNILIYLLISISAALSFIAGIFDLTYLTYVSGTICVIIPILKLSESVIGDIDEKTNKLNYIAGKIANNTL
jgi:hypothetical protein